MNKLKTFLFSFLFTVSSAQAAFILIDSTTGAESSYTASGNDTAFITGTAGTDGNCVKWNADGDAVDAGAACGGSGGVDTSGSPVANDFARFFDADTIEGRSYAEARADLSLEDADIKAIARLARSNDTIVGSNLSLAVDTFYVLDIDGMTGERYAEFPSGTAEGQQIVLYAETDAPTTVGRELVPVGDTGVTLVQGGTSSTAAENDKYRMLNAGELLAYRWDNTDSKWVLWHDGLIPCVAHADSDNATWNDGGFTQLSITGSTGDNCNLVDTTNDRFNVRRDGTYSWGHSLITTNNVTSPQDNDITCQTLVGSAVSGTRFASIYPPFGITGSSRISSVLTLMIGSVDIGTDQYIYAQHNNCSEDNTTTIAPSHLIITEQR